MEKTDFFCGYKDFGYKKILHVWGIILVKSDCTWNCGDDHRAVASASIYKSENCEFNG